MPLSLLAGPANAGKVALLLERYLDALDSDPILIVPNRPDVDRAERELLDARRRARRRLDRHLRRPLRADRAGQRLASAGDHARRSGRCCLRRVVERSRGPFRALLRFRRLARLDGRRARVRAARARRAGRRAGGSSTAPTARSSTGSGSGIASSSAAMPPSAPPATSPPGSRGRCSRTASRT